jgi:hypothetical protein
LRTSLPRIGTYRLIADVKPQGALPEILPRFISTAGFGGPIDRKKRLPVDLKPKKTENLTIATALDPVKPLAGLRTHLIMTVEPVAGLEKYLGVWAHLLAVSEDVTEAIHTHPETTNVPGVFQFDVIFPKSGNYRIWTQFQRNGVVNTAVFTIPVTGL